MRLDACRVFYTHVRRIPAPVTTHVLHCLKPQSGSSRFPFLCNPDDWGLVFNSCCTLQYAAYFPNGELKFNDQGILHLNGDTGISAGIEAALQSIIGQVRAIPIFITVSGPGNNADYTIVKFVGVRIMAVKLTGGPMQRYVRVQPAPFSTRYTNRGNILVNIDSVFSQPLLIE